jgi:hypothetical protein
MCDLWQKWEYWRLQPSFHSILSMPNWQATVVHAFQQQVNSHAVQCSAV